MNKLDKVSSEYKPGSATEIENNLILNWYPNRILDRLGREAPGSILELGIGHGYTTALFNKFFDRPEVIDGSTIVIEQFRNDYSLDSIEIVESYFESFDTDEVFDGL